MGSDEMGLITLGLAIILAGFVGFILGIIGFFKSQRLERSVYALSRQVAELSRGGIAPAASQEFVATPVVEKIVEPEPVVEEVIEAEKTVAAAEPVLFAAEPSRDIEGNLASRWFVWIGGVAVALAGLLFIKYAHDQGLISPFLRILIGLLIAAGFVAAGEYVRRSRGTGIVDYVPAALSAAGLVMGFGVVYAAFGLYDLVSPAVAFIGLGLLAYRRFGYHGCKAR